MAAEEKARPCTGELVHEPFLTAKAAWPQKGKHILAQYNEEAVVVYQVIRCSLLPAAREHAWEVVIVCVLEAACQKTAVPSHTANPAFASLLIHVLSGDTSMLGSLP